RRHAALRRRLPGCRGHQRAAGPDPEHHTCPDPAPDPQPGRQAPAADPADRLLLLPDGRLRLHRLLYPHLLPRALLLGPQLSVDQDERRGPAGKEPAGPFALAAPGSGCSWGAGGAGAAALFAPYFGWPRRRVGRILGLSERPAPSRGRETAKEQPAR